MADEPKTVHVWLPGGRTLCDRRGPGDARATEDESKSAPYCGACTFLTWTLHRMDWFRAADSVYEARGVWPPVWRDAVGLLGGTGWSEQFDLQGLLDDGERVKYHYPRYESEERARATRAAHGVESGG